MELGVTEIVVSIIGALAVIIPAIITVKRSEKKITGHISKETGSVSDTVSNGLKSLVESIHRDMQLTVLPSLAEFKEFKESYPWESKEAFDKFISRVGNIEQAQLELKENLLELKERLIDSREVQEEWKEKHSELVIHIAELVQKLEP